MPNIKSAEKRMRQNAKLRLHNRYFRGQARAAIKTAQQAFEAEDLEAARLAVTKASSALDKAAQKNILHKNNASRRKSRLMKQLAALENKQAS